MGAILPPNLNKLITDPTGQPSGYPFPPNIAASLPKRLRQRLMLFMLHNYIWPQIQERQPYEVKWDKLLDMARATWKYDDLKVDPKGRAARARQEKVLAGSVNPSNRVDVADTVIFDAVDRLSNLNHFISFKDELPMKWQMPKNIRRPLETSVYSPTNDLVDAANAWTEYNANQEKFYRKHRMLAHHHYTYGCSFVVSEYNQVIENVNRRQPDNSFKLEPELTQLSITFEPISIRKLWLNIKIPVYEMDHQPCPFFFQEIPKFVIQANPYDATTRPFGYQNLDSLPQAQWLFGASETESVVKALQQSLPDISLQSLSRPEYDVQLNWVFYPMLPLKQITQQENPEAYQHELDQMSNEERTKFATVANQSPDPNNPQQQQMPPLWCLDDMANYHFPLQRFIMEAFGTSLVSGTVEITRLQENFYPFGKLPIYGSCHMSDLDSGVYAPAIGEILECHYVEIVRAIQQYLDNKDLLNDPPTKMQINSPAQNKDINKKGAKNSVNSMNDYEAHAILDSTGTTQNFIQATREQAKTTSKATDAILGEAMGSRTSATEANNVFQTAMSGATTDINLFNADIGGGYAERCWDYASIFVDPDVLKAVTGQFGFAIKPEHFYIRLHLNCAIGSTFIDSLTRQQNFRYILETGANNPAINSAYLWLELLKEWKIPNAEKIVNDQGFCESVQEANNQACMTYLGELVLVDPDQDHSIAIQVKKAYLKDTDSVWNSQAKYAINGQKLVEQIALHAKYLQLQQLQMEAQMAAQDPAQQNLPPPSNPNSGFLPSGQAALPIQNQ